MPPAPKLFNLRWSFVLDWWGGKAGGLALLNFSYGHSFFLFCSFCFWSSLCRKFEEGLHSCCVYDLGLTLHVSVCLHHGTCKYKIV